MYFVGFGYFQSVKRYKDLILQIVKIYLKPFCKYKHTTSSRRHIRTSHVAQLLEEKGSYVSHFREQYMNILPFKN